MKPKQQNSKAFYPKTAPVYKPISVRLTQNTIDVLEKIASNHNMSRNNIIRLFVEYSIELCQFIEHTEQK